MGMYDHRQGVLSAEFSLLEYGDFECPYSRKAAPVIQEVSERLGERLVFGFRHFPLAGLHPFTLPAALAAEAAAIKGRFWPMYDRFISGDEPRLRQEDLRRYAEEIGIPPEHVVWPATQFVEDRVEADVNSGVRSGVRGTPTLFVKGKQYHGTVSVGDLLTAIEKSAGHAEK
jgi:protein-disulfide isomerase